MLESLVANIKKLFQRALSGGILFRSLLIALCATLMTWGIFLLPQFTLSSSATHATVFPDCQATGARLECRKNLKAIGYVDPGAPAAQELPADHFFSQNATGAFALPSWNPYIGSGYPIALDGHYSRYSPTRAFLRLFPSSSGRDWLIFLRILLWTTGITLCVLLMGGGLAAALVTAMAATLAPYHTSYIDIVFLDGDMLGPWIAVILLAITGKQISLKVALTSALILGILIGLLGFLQSQFVFLLMVAIFAMVAAPQTHGRSLLVGIAAGLGFLFTLPAWIPVVENIGHFFSSRNATGCIAVGAIGRDSFLNSLLKPTIGTNNIFLFGSLAGFGLIAITTLAHRQLFPLLSLTAIGYLLVWGMPDAICDVPGVSGIRFVRHLLPYAQFLFLSMAGIGIHTTITSLKNSKKPPVFWLTVPALTFLTLFYRENLAIKIAFLGGSVTLLALAIFARRFTKYKSGLIAAGIGLLVFPPISFSAVFLPKLLAHGPAREVAAVNEALDPTSPLGAVQKLSISEDRRHYSPSTVLFPNWSAAFNILDMRVLYAIYPQGYFELNGGLTDKWDSDPGNMIKPDRFVRNLPTKSLFESDFQRLLLLNRISLFTFTPDDVVFSTLPGPYEESKCRLLAEDTKIKSYICPEMGGVGYFPRLVQTAGSKAQALEILKKVPLSDLEGLAVITQDGLGSPQVLKPAQGRVEKVIRTADSLDYELVVSSPGIFMVTDTYFPGWSATINELPTPILRGNITFKAMIVPQGKVNLQLHYSVPHPILKKLHLVN
ncbi:hypothetical protein WDW37_20120 [Bdellovibrionota bacterium FG-1]